MKERVVGPAFTRRDKIALGIMSLGLASAAVGLAINQLDATPPEHTVFQEGVGLDIALVMSGMVIMLAGQGILINSMKPGQKIQNPPTTDTETIQ